MRNAADILKERYIDEVNIYDNFNPYRIKENVEPFMGGLPIIFMTTPSMSIIDGDAVYENLALVNPLFTLLETTDFNLLKGLQYGEGGTNSPFIKILTNRFKGITLKDFVMSTTDEHETYYGWKQILPGSTVENFTAEGSLIVTFSETKNLDITKYNYAWMNYIEAVRYGTYEPKASTRSTRTLDFTSSLYFFLLDFDMRTILYFCKYTGVYPTNVPLGSTIISDNISTTKNMIDSPITFAYQYKEEMNPQILYDFNIVSEDPGSLFKNLKHGEDGTPSLYGGFKQYNPTDYMITSTLNIEDKKDNSSTNALLDDGRDYLYVKNYNTPVIRMANEESYDSNSQTSFNSAETNKTTFVMEFLNTNEKATAASIFNDGTSSNGAAYKSSALSELKNKIRGEALALLASTVGKSFSSVDDLNTHREIYELWLENVNGGDIKDAKDVDWSDNPVYASEEAYEYAKECWKQQVEREGLQEGTVEYEERYAELEKDYWNINSGGLQYELGEDGEKLSAGYEDGDFEQWMQEYSKYENPEKYQELVTLVNKAKEKTNEEYQASVDRSKYDTYANQSAEEFANLYGEFYGVI